MARRPGGVMVQEAEPTRSQLIPIVTKWQDIGKKAQLAPALFCMATFFALITFGSTSTIVEPVVRKGYYMPPQYWVYTSRYLIILAIFLTVASLYFIYRLVGKSKSWWVMFAAMAFTAYFLWLFTFQGDFGWLYNFFHHDLAGGEPNDNAPFLQLFMRHFLGTGFFEEFVKAIPVLLLAFGAKYIPPNLRSKFAVQEPLDGILVGAAGGGGFAIMETLLQYIPRYLYSKYLVLGIELRGITTTAQFKQEVAKLNYMGFYQKFIEPASGLLKTSPGIGQLIVRSIDLSFGHMAYSGYFGYFIGLAVIKPESRWKILAIGLISASIPHALWDSVASLNSAPLEAGVAVFSYAVLAAAILKAREISPNRAVLQPSVVFGAGFYPAPAVAVAGVPGMEIPVPAVRVVPAADIPPARPVLPLAPPVDGGGRGKRLRVGSKYLVIVPGLRLLEHQIPGLKAQQPGGLVAEVTRNPGDPDVLGLTNLSASTWEVVSGSGARRQITSGQTIRLSPGTRIDFGSVDGEVN